MSENDGNKPGKRMRIEKGNTSDLNISPVYTHLKIEKPKTNAVKKNKIVIPEEKNKK